MEEKNAMVKEFNGIKILDLVTCSSPINGTVLNSFYRVVGILNVGNKFCMERGGLFRLQDIVNGNLYEAFGHTLTKWAPVKSNPQSKKPLKNKEYMLASERIKQLRQKAGLGQCDLAKKTGISQSFISQLENGARYGLPETMEVLAEALGCSFEDLTGEPKFFVQFIRNCKQLTQPQLLAVNTIVLQLINNLQKTEKS